MEDKRIKLSVDDRKLQELKSETEKMARDMISSSRRLSTSSKEVLRDIEEQIKAIEKRNKLEVDFDRNRAERMKSSGGFTQDQYKSAIQQSRLDQQTGNLQVQLLRELIDVEKQRAKEEVRENRREVEDRIRASDRVESLRPSGDERDILRETIQYGMIGDLSSSEREQRTGFRDRAKRYGDRFNQASSMAAGSPNEFYLAAAVLGLMPIVGQGMSTLANRVIGGAGRYESGLKSLAQTQRGYSQESAIGMVEGLGDASYYSRFGMTYADVAQNFGKYRGLTANKAGGRTMLNMMAAERVLGIDQGMMGDLASIMRYSSSTGTTTSRVKTGTEDIYGMGWGISGTNKTKIGERDVYKNVSTTYTTGIMEAISIFDRASKGNTAIMKEMLGTFQQTSHQILAISGNIDMARTAANITGISRATGTEGLQLGRVTQGIMGLGQSQNPMVRSMMLRALRQSNPNASFFDVQSMMENPLGSIGATSSMFKSLKDMTGGGELYKQALFSTFGGQLSRTDINQILGKGGSFEDIAKKAKQVGMGASDYVGNLDKVTGKIEASTAKIDSYAQGLGKDVVEALDGMFEKLREGIGDIFGTKEEQYRNNKRAYKDAMTEYAKTNPMGMGGVMKPF